MVVSKPEKALEALTKAGFICKLSDVLGIEVKDEVGNLNKTASQSPGEQHQY